jgi:hypothetical protein
MVAGGLRVRRLTETLPAIIDKKQFRRSAPTPNSISNSFQANAQTPLPFVPSKWHS